MTKKTSDLKHLTYRLQTKNAIKHTFLKLNREYPRSDHRHGSGFHNIAPRPEHLTGWSIFKWVATRSKLKARWQKYRDIATYDLPQNRPDATLIDWQAYFVGHATVLLQIGPYNFLTDPVWCDYVSPMQGQGPERFIPMGVALEQLPKIDAVLLSHNHYDHMDLATLLWLHEHFSMPIYTGLGNGEYLPKELNVIEMDWWQAHKFGVGQEIKIAYVPAQHGSGRGLRDQNQALWGGFSLLTESGHAYFAGDAAYSHHYKEIYARYGAPRIALLPIGAYEPRHLMQYLHMNPDDAVKAHVDLKAQKSLAIHHRMFQLTDEGQHQPVIDLDIALRTYGVDSQHFICLEEGQSIQL